MSENTNGTNNVESNGTVESKRTRADGEVFMKMYATREECEANPLSIDTKNVKCYEVEKDNEVVGYVWARGYEHGLHVVAKLQGYAIGLAVKGKRGVSKAAVEKAVEDRLATIMDTLTSEQLKTLGLLELSKAKLAQETLAAHQQSLKNPKKGK